MDRHFGAILYLAAASRDSWKGIPWERQETRGYRNRVRFGIIGLFSSLLIEKEAAPRAQLIEFCLHTLSRIACGENSKFCGYTEPLPTNFRPPKGFGRQTAAHWEPKIVSVVARHNEASKAETRHSGGLVRYRQPRIVSRCQK